MVSCSSNQKILKSTFFEAKCREIIIKAYGEAKNTPRSCQTDYVQYFCNVFLLPAAGLSSNALEKLMINNNY